MNAPHETALPGDALLLLGHGSTLNGDSSAPTWQHAEEIRRRNIFGEVHVGFWKEEPNFRQVLRQTRLPRVYVVPNFISSGYFTEQVIPRELGLTGPVTQLGDQEIIYCEPVGLHASMTEALLQRACGVVAVSAAKIDDPARTACLFICGHGTSFNDNSTKIIHEQAAAIRACGLYADCQPVLMEQAPFVRDWRTLTNCPDVIVVPFFIADGLHSFEDIPVLLGLTHNVREKGFANPHLEGERRLWYATAIGTERLIADVILAQVDQAMRQYSPATRAVSFTHFSLETRLDRMLKQSPPPWKMGQVLIQPGFELRHVDDAKIPARELTPLNGERPAFPPPDPEAMTTAGIAWQPGDAKNLRELARLDAAGNFRPLRAAPNLKRGWIYRAPDLAALRLALEYLYPGELANAVLADEKKLPVTPWSETSERQTGRFRIVREIGDDAIRELTNEYCQRGCLKKRLWPPAQNSPAAGTDALPLLCPEACNFLVGKAREKLKGPDSE
jgi:sirohydrochlorin cobaltochelatase